MMWSAYSDERSSQKRVMQLLYPISEIQNGLDQFLSTRFNSEDLAWLLNKIDPTFKEWSLEERMTFALKYSCKWRKVGSCTADIVSLMLHKDQLNEVCCKMVIRCHPRSIGDTFLSNELGVFGFAVQDWFKRTGELFMYYDSPQPKAGKSESGPSDRFLKDEILTSFEFLKRLVAAGSEIYRGSLLYHLLDEILGTYAPEILRSWVCPVFIDSRWTLYFSPRKEVVRPGKQRYGGTCAQIISFVYGPAPEDWKFWYSLDEPYWYYYKNLRDFWELVDHPERGMPGAWEEY
ncbi:hypothetical protein EAF00_003335 [Botryotinia globosa]|nr:hypothetical protein EAF00_003335 [Botryotinia globosa]